MGTKLDANFLVDTELLLHKGTREGGSLVAADAVGSEGILDIGAGELLGLIAIDLVAAEVADGSELYNVVAEFSNSATFASGVVPGSAMAFGNSGIADTLLDNASADRATAGRYLLPFCNVIGGTVYRYMRLYVHVVGTIATGIDFTAYISPPRQ